jgi:hypothetical protein
LVASRLATALSRATSAGTVAAEAVRTLHESLRLLPRRGAAARPRWGAPRRRLGRARGGAMVIATELRAGAGSQFEPDTVAALLAELA